VEQGFGEMAEELELDPVDWEQLRLLAKLTPGERIMAMARTSAFSRALLRGAFRRRYPDLPIEEINRMMMRYVDTLKEKGL
jgi:hypothetical protein